jgi:hypothetical protein
MNICIEFISWEDGNGVCVEFFTWQDENDMP